MKKALLIGGCAIAAGFLGGKLLRKCVDKITENKSDEVKKEVKDTVAKTLIIAGGVATVYGLVSVYDSIDSRINIINNNTELCWISIILNSSDTNLDKIEVLKAAKEKFTSQKTLELIDKAITELMGGVDHE